MISPDIAVNVTELHAIVTSPALVPSLSNAVESPICKYCLGEDKKTNLIMPCNCSGTQAFVHRACLDRWRTSDPEHIKFSKCLVCNTLYQYIPSHQNRLNILRYKLKLALLVCADIFVILIFAFGAISVLGVLSWLIGMDELACKWNFNVITTCLLIGIIEFFTLISWTGLLMIACGPEILASYILCNLEPNNANTYLACIVFVMFGAVIGLAAVARYIVYRISLRADKNNLTFNSIIYAVVDLGPLRDRALRAL